MLHNIVVMFRAKKDYLDYLHLESQPKSQSPFLYYTPEERVLTVSLERAMAVSVQPPTPGHSAMSNRYLVDAQMISVF